ncbi:purine-nucleoside phosphorylase [Canibacter sp. lx-45]|uniref:phosphorylase family protein n=1 Tax=Canibacter zhuwentaonis TaxID=2837491 RepID=UPI001BDDB83C|nr:purine-nucleoside phosphorylase [Canibacter zhuwentaonis]MBT1035608.1 purine-nucleoside phosphorylase [Canibacter zhuwentaonis]
MRKSNELLVFAHVDEASAFQDVPHLVTGVGKINAAAGLAHHLHEAAARGHAISRVTVFGTAGIVAHGHDIDTIVQVTRAVQHDFSLPTPALTAGKQILDSTATIATGDVFVKSDRERERIAKLGATLVDMESYAYLQTAAIFGAPIRIFKVPSDFADDTLTDADWDEIVFLKSQQLRYFYDEVLPFL